MRRFALLLTVLLLACSSAEEFPRQEYQPREFSPQDTVRPEINRTQTSTTSPDRPEQEEQETVVPVEQLSPPVKEYRLEVGYGAFRLGRSLANRTKTFTKYDFPDLLKSRDVRGATYEQKMRLAEGSIRFRPDEEDVVSDYLYYAEDEPILRYTFSLQGATFLDIIGETVEVLGNTYEVVEATKQDIILQGDGARLVIGGGSVQVNGATLAATDSRMYGDRFIVESRADSSEHVYIPAGSSVQEQLEKPTLLTDKLDILYKGLVETPAVTFRLRNLNDHVKLDVNEQGRRVTVPLVDEDGWGDDEGDLVFRETERVTPGDYIVLSSDRSHVLQYHGIDGDELDFSSATIDVAVKLNRSSLPLGGREYRYTRENTTLRVDLNGDGDRKDTVRFSRPGYAVSFRNGSVAFTFHGDVTRTIRFGEDLELIPAFDGYDIRDGFVHATTYGTRYVFRGETGSGFEDGRIMYPTKRGKGEIVLKSLADRTPHVGD